MKKLFLVFLLIGVPLIASEDYWENLKKIYFYEAMNEVDNIEYNLAEINGDFLTRNQKQELVLQLIQLGDYYYIKKNYVLAGKFYKKALKISPQDWIAFNRFDKIDGVKGKLFLNFKNMFNQFISIFKNFEPSFILINNLLNLTFFTMIFIFFIYAVLIFWKYFKLITNDIFSKDKRISIVKAILILLLFVWPAFILSGWIIYPFLISGFLWVYLEEYERKTVFLCGILVLISSLFYCFNLYLERSIESDNFKTVQKVFYGHLFNSTVYKDFDDELKVYQAFSYYENGQPTVALDILNSTSKDYRSAFKYDIMGDIHFNSGNITKSIEYYRESLSINDKNQRTLSNFTIALLKNKSLNIFDSYAKRYPEILEYKKNVYKLRGVEREPFFLWRRVLFFAKDTFGFKQFIKVFLDNFLKLMVWALFVIMLIYIILFKRLFSSIGQSTYCSKCSKIIIKSSTQKSHELCSECYQLFLIKDPIFLEAKILKENELRKQNKLRYFGYLFLSLFIPGFMLNYKEKSWVFIIFSSLFFFFLGFYIINVIVFNQFYDTVPTILHFSGMLAFMFYFLTNLFSIKGERYGF